MLSRMRILQTSSHHDVNKQMDAGCCICQEKHRTNPPLQHGASLCCWCTSLNALSLARPQVHHSIHRAWHIQDVHDDVPKGRYGHCGSLYGLMRMWFCLLTLLSCLKHWGSGIEGKAERSRENLKREVLQSWMCLLKWTDIGWQIHQ